jgi:hypothetical protein
MNRAQRRAAGHRAPAAPRWHPAYSITSGDIGDGSTGLLVGFGNEGARPTDLLPLACAHSALSMAEELRAAAQAILDDGTACCLREGEHVDELAVH